MKVRRIFSYVLLINLIGFIYNINNDNKEYCRTELSSFITNNLNLEKIFDKNWFEILSFYNDIKGQCGILNFNKIENEIYYFTLTYSTVVEGYLKKFINQVYCYTHNPTNSRCIIKPNRNNLIYGDIFSSLEFFIYDIDNQNYLVLTSCFKSKIKAIWVFTNTNNPDQVNIQTIIYALEYLGIKPVKNLKFLEINKCSNNKINKFSPKTEDKFLKNTDINQLENDEKLLFKAKCEKIEDEILKLIVEKVAEEKAIKENDKQTKIDYEELYLNKLLEIKHSYPIEYKELEKKLKIEN